MLTGDQTTASEGNNEELGLPEKAYSGFMIWSRINSCWYDKNNTSHHSLPGSVWTVFSPVSAGRDTLGKTRENSTLGGLDQDQKFLLWVVSRALADIEARGLHSYQQTVRRPRTEYQHGGLADWDLVMLQTSKYKCKHALSRTADLKPNQIT